MVYSIRRLEIPISIRALRTASIYLLDNGKRRILIDTGMDKNIVDFLRTNQIDPNQIDLVLLSHMHIDHIGGAQELQNQFGIKAYIGRNDLERIESLQESPKKYISWQLDYLKENGVPDKFLQNIGENHPIFKELKNYLSLDLNSLEKIDNKLENIEFLPVPGHSSGSTCFLIKDQNAIFTGDHVLERITPNISYYDESEDMLGEYISSLKNTIFDQPLEAHPGHGHQFGDLNKRIDGILNHHEERIGEILKIVEKKWVCAYDVARQMKWSKGRTMDSMNMMESNFAIGEAISHLRHMSFKGMVSKKEINGVHYYSD
ncbi:MAG: MBL fold metallo-hydrolase [Cuniculiplasma sp.]